MRFESLSLEHYGRHERQTLNFPPAPGFVLIYGRNEAGKSTSLEAIADFLFGVPETSQRGKIFGNDSMRLSASIVLSNGTRLALRRRKGRGKTLTNESGQAVDETVLAPVLGATSRDRFISLFGLGHAALRSGGKDLLAAGGDIGRLILEAGGGLGSLVGIVEALEQDASKLFGTRRKGDRAFYVALDAFNKAEDDVKSGLMTRERYDKARQQQNAAKDNEASLRERQNAMMEENSRLERLKHAVPAIREFDRIKEELAAFAGLPPLREDFAISCATALDHVRRTEEALQEAKARCAAGRSRVENLVLPAAILGAEAKIRDAAEKAIHIGKARFDRPNREIELAGFNDKIKSLRSRLGLDGGADLDLEAAAPSQEAIARAQHLTAEGLERRGKIGGLAGEHAREAKSLAAVQKRQAERRAKGMDKPFGHKAADFSSLAALAGSKALKETQAAAAKREIEAAIARHGFGGIEDLQAWSCPDEAAIQLEIDRRAASETEWLRSQEKRATAIESCDQAVADISRLQSGEKMPSREDMESIRADRDQIFDEIKSRYLSLAAAAERPQADRQADIEHHESLKSFADVLADRRVNEADRAAKLELAQQQQAEALRILAALDRRESDLAKQAAITREAWTAAWPEAVARQANPGRLKALLAERVSILARHRDWRAMAGEAEALDAALAPRLEALSLAEDRLALPTGTSLTARCNAVSVAIEVHDAAYADYRANENILAGIREKLKSVEDSQNVHSLAEHQWRAAWGPAVRALGLSEPAVLEDVNEIATQWAAAAGIFQGLRQASRRLERMDADEEELRALVNAIAAGLDFPLPQDTAAAAGALRERLDEARKIKIERDSAERQLAEMLGELEKKRELATVAQTAAAALCQEADCAPEALAGLSARLARKIELEGKLRELAKAVTGHGDGESIEALRAQWAGRDLDEMTAAAAQFKSKAAGLDTEINEAYAARRDRDRDLSALISFEGLNAAIADRELATTEIHDVLERYVEIALAGELLREAMNRLRDQRKDPLVQRAGELFAASTAGAFAGVVTDIDGKGLPVVMGRRASGEEVPVALMSDGVRDQLYLAFRIASIERYCQAAEPLPFIADDLLIHFDDERGGATLGLLAELGRVTQVLAFTHHRHLMDLAAPLAADKRAAIIDLAG